MRDSLCYSAQQEAPAFHASDSRPTLDYPRCRQFQVHCFLLSLSLELAVSSLSWYYTATEPVSYPSSPQNWRCEAAIFLPLVAECHRSGSSTAPLANHYLVTYSLRDQRAAGAGCDG